MIRPFIRFVAVTVMAALAGACAGGSALPALPALPDLPPNEPLRASGRVTDVYTRIARGSSACWFGADGALKGSYIFHAEVAPPSKGEVAEIAIHEIDRTQPSPWGRRVFRVQLVPVDGATSIAVDNLAMDEEIARRMRADLFQWIDGKPACTTKEAPGLTAVATGSPPRQQPATSSKKPAASPGRAL